MTEIAIYVGQQFFWFVSVLPKRHAAPASDGWNSTGGIGMARDTEPARRFAQTTTAAPSVAGLTWARKALNSSRPMPSEAVAGS